jgi:DNA-binding response OmpR family regulator
MCNITNQQIISLKARISLLEDLLKTREEESEAARRELRQNNQQNKISISKITGIAEKRKLLIQNFKQRADKFKEKLQALESGIPDLEEYQEKILFLEAKVNSINGLEEKIRGLHSENGVLRSTINNLINQNETLQNLTNSLKEKNTELTEQVNHQLFELDERKQIINNLNYDKYQNDNFIETSISPIPEAETIPRKIESGENDQLEAGLAEEADYTGKILIVDDDPMSLNILERTLSKNGYKVVLAKSAIEGAELLKSEFYGLVITDINMPEVNGLEFMLWIKQHSPKSQVILITGFGSHEIKHFVNQNGALGYFEKPVNLKQLLEFIHNNVKKDATQKIQDIELFDFIQIISFSGKDKLISVKDPVINQNGLIYIKNGQIVHAESSDKIGEEAFYSLISLQSGIFTDQPWIEPVVSTIKSSMTEILSKAAEIRDEANRGTENDLIRSRPRQIEKALEQREALEKLRQETKFLKKLTIYESGVAMGIVLGRSSKDEVIKTMKNFSRVNGEIQRENQMYFFDDISLTVLFNENEIVEEFNFGRLYLGETERGIKINDPIEKAIEIYGKPKTCTIKGAVWENIAFFSLDSIYISSIRMRNLNFFNTEKEKMVETQEDEGPLTLKSGRGRDSKISVDTGKQTFKNLGKKSGGINRKNVSSEPVINYAPPDKYDALPTNERPVSRNDYTIFETGSFLNIHLGKTTIGEVKHIMKKYSKSSGEFIYSRSIISYEDLSLNILFNELGIVKEINFGTSYPGITSKGIKIGDTIAKAVEIYGPTQYMSKKSAIWYNIAFFADETNLIYWIRLRDV